MSKRMQDVAASVMDWMDGLGEEADCVLSLAILLGGALLVWAMSGLM